MANEQPQTGGGGFNREVLAWTILAFSAVGITAVAIVVLFKGATTDAQTVFTALVALFGTWVGTILAFYFSKENFEAANRGVMNAFDKVTASEERLKGTRVRAAMIPRSSIVGVELKGRAPNAVPLKEVCELLKQKPRVILFDDKGAVPYIIHDSMVYKYISDQALDKNTVANPATVMLDTFFAHVIDGGTIGDQVKLIGYVDVEASLADAREKMLATKGSKDVVVTKTGKADEPAEGWITDVDIARQAQVS